MLPLSAGDQPWHPARLMTEKNVHNRVSTKALPFVILVLCGIAWGATIPMAKVAVSTGHPPMGLIFWQVCILSVALGFIALWRREHVPRQPRHLAYYTLIAAIGTLIPSSVSFYVAAKLPAGVLGLLLATVPMFSLLIALAIRSEGFQTKRMAGIALGVAAMILLATPELSLPGAGMAWLLLLGLFAPFCYGMEGNIVERIAPADMSPIAAILASSIIGIPISGAIAWFGGMWVDLGQAWGTAEWALLGSSLGHAAAYTGYVALVGLAGAVFSSQIAYVTTLSAILVSIIFLGESYPVTTWVAIAMMMGGLLLVQPAGKMPES